MNSSNSEGAEHIEQLVKSREAFINNYRVTGVFDRQAAKAIENKARVYSNTYSGTTRVRSLYEVATMQRLSGKFNNAIDSYARANEEAKSLRLKDIEFETWLGIARAHAYGSRDHGAARAAFEQAIASAANNATQEQRYKLADYASQIAAGMGDLDSALIEGLEAIRLAQTGADLYYAQLDTADVLQKYAESCDYRKLIDSKSQTDNDDGWGACRRAVLGADNYYSAAKTTAEKLGWNHLVRETQGFLDQLRLRLALIEQKASFEKITGSKSLFNAQDVGDVLVNEQFSAGAQDLSPGSPLRGIIDKVTSQSDERNPRTLYLLGLKADMGGNYKEALGYFDRAVTLLQGERASYLDPRRRGTIIENRPEIVRDLALRLLALGQKDKAFLAFESIRSYGLGQLSAAYKQVNLNAQEKRWLADLIQLDSKYSANLNDLVATTIAGAEHSKSIQRLAELEQLDRNRRALLASKPFQKTLAALNAVQTNNTTLRAMQEVVGETKVPLILYWVTHTNVIVWVISDTGMDIKTVFLPEVALLDKVNKLQASSLSKDTKFDEQTARELHTYLIKPFAKYLNREQLVVVPHGPLVGLPFEMLIDASTGKFLAEDIGVSYSPNATFAFQALNRPKRTITKTTAIYDRELENSTDEIAKIIDIGGLSVTTESITKMDKARLVKVLSDSENVHVLSHGSHNRSDPLQSTIAVNTYNPDQSQRRITAAELLSADWQGKYLVMFSSCEGAYVNNRISNEQQGLSWVLMVGGVENIVVSRWRVKAATNAQWMNAFYRAVAIEKATPSIAAVAAMRAMISSGQRHPYLWAGPQVFGR